jgi:hypothetical protein
MNIQQQIKHWHNTKRSYIAKLKELQTYGTENRNGQRIDETKSSIKVVRHEINRLKTKL